MGDLVQDCDPFYEKPKKTFSSFANPFPPEEEENEKK